MRGTCRLAIVAGLIVVAGRSSLLGQGTGNTGSVSRAEAVELTNLVDRVAGGRPPGGDAWLKWSGHFLRASDGRVHVPFTVALDDVNAGFESIAMYVRVVPRDAKGPAGPSRVRGSDLATPVSAPERQFARGNPTAGEASARLGLLATELGTIKPPFEGFFVARTPPRPAPLLVRRSLVVAPGEYDLYVAVQERPTSGARAAPKWAVLEQPLTVPDLTGTEPTLSSIILADRIEAIGKRLSSSQEAERPYAFGSAEVFPHSNAPFTSRDMLVVVFFAYNLAVDEGNLPDVTVGIQVPSDERVRRDLRRAAAATTGPQTRGAGIRFQGRPATGGDTGPAPGHLSSRHIRARSRRDRPSVSPFDSAHRAVRRGSLMAQVTGVKGAAQTGRDLSRSSLVSCPPELPGEPHDAAVRRIAR